MTENGGDTMSDIYNHLQAIIRFYDVLQTDSVNYKHFTDLQKFQAEYTETYKANTDYTRRQYQSINNA